MDLMLGNACFGSLAAVTENEKILITLSSLTPIYANPAPIYANSTILPTFFKLSFFHNT